MNLKKFLPATLAGYLFMVLIVYLVFDYFSLWLTIGLIIGAILFALIAVLLGKRAK